MPAVNITKTFVSIIFTNVTAVIGYSLSLVSRFSQVYYLGVSLFYLSGVEFFGLTPKYKTWLKMDKHSSLFACSANNKHFGDMTPRITTLIITTYSITMNQVGHSLLLMLSGLYAEFSLC